MAAGRCYVSSRKRDVFTSRENVYGGDRDVEIGRLLRGNGVWSAEVGRCVPQEKRRKISSDINVRSRDEKEVRISSRNRVVVSTNACLRLSSKHEIASSGSERIGVFEVSNAAMCVHKSSSSDGEVGLVEGQRLSAWNGLTSRWGDKLELNGDDVEPMGKKVDYEDATPAASVSLMSSPENGEILSESSGKNRSSSTPEIGSSSLNLMDRDDKYSAYQFSDGSMEVDGNHSGLCQLNPDSEDNVAFPGRPKCRGMNMLQGCRSAFEYEKLQKINEGTYGIVYKARDKLTGDIVALKKVKMGKNTEGFPITSLREINILASHQHPAIVEVKEVVMDDHNGVFVVMEYMEHDLKQLVNAMKQPFSQSEVKCLMLQLLEGVKFLHDNWVLHRDLKTSNLLFNNRGELKICDFGMARQYGSPLKPYTALVVTLWYRAPELLLGAKQYSTSIDMWSVGCIMAEMLAKEALFMGESEIQQLDKIFRVLGTPNEAIWPGFSSLPGSNAKFVKQPYNLLRKKFPAATFTGSPVLTELGFDLLSRLLTYDPEKRITADEALNHGWFREVPLPKSKEFMPTFPVQHANTRKV